MNKGDGESNKSLTNNHPPKIEQITMKTVVALYHFELF